MIETKQAAQPLPRVYWRDARCRSPHRDRRAWRLPENCV